MPPPPLIVDEVEIRDHRLSRIDQRLAMGLLQYLSADERQRLQTLGSINPLTSAMDTARSTSLIPKSAWLKPEFTDDGVLMEYQRGMFTPLASELSALPDGVVLRSRISALCLEHGLLPMVNDATLQLISLATECYLKNILADCIGKVRPKRKRHPLHELKQKILDIEQQQQQQQRSSAVGTGKASSATTSDMFQATPATRSSSRRGKQDPSLEVQTRGLPVHGLPPKSTALSLSSNPPSQTASPFRILFTAPVTGEDGNASALWDKPTTALHSQKHLPLSLEDLYFSLSASQYLLGEQRYYLDRLACLLENDHEDDVELDFV